MKERLSSFSSALVAFSGGIDSAFLLKVAAGCLGERAVAVTARSPSLPQSELEQAIEVATEIGVRHVIEDTAEMDLPEYTVNAHDRCYHCKRELFRAISTIGRELDIDTILIGANVDDLGDYRPGHKAITELGIETPLIDVGLTKQEIRTAARQMGLSVWDKPAKACLASRSPYGTPITPESLKQIERCEEVLAELGFKTYRARFHDTVVRIETSAEEIERALDPTVRQQIVEGCMEAGFLFVTLDLRGYRQGSMNVLL